MNQNDQIIGYLKMGNTLTSLEALQLFGCFRLASRISDLKGQGYFFDVEMKALPSGKKVAQYRYKGHLAYETTGQKFFV